MVTLAQNYRSSGPILAAANAVIAAASERFTKDPVDRALRRCHAAARVGAR